MEDTDTFDGGFEWATRRSSEVCLGLSGSSDSELDSEGEAGDEEKCASVGATQTAVSGAVDGFLHATAGGGGPLTFRIFRSDSVGGEEPAYVPLTSRLPDHESICRIPEGVDLHSPLALFRQMWSEIALDTIVENTNLYAAWWGREKKCPLRIKDWRPLCIEELLIWIGIVVYVGLFRVARPHDCWKQDDRYPQYPFTAEMALHRFETIRSVLRLCPPPAAKTKRDSSKSNQGH